jgi:hypothetical protein
MKFKLLSVIYALLGTMRGIKTSLPVMNGKLNRSVTYYKAGSLKDVAGVNGKIILASDKPKPGVTNFQLGNTLQKGKPVFVDSLRMLFDITPGATVETADWKEVAPACFANGEFEITQAGTGVLFSTSGTDVTNSKASTGNDDDFREIHGFLLRDGVEFQITATLVGSVPSDALYKLELRGTEMPDADIS